MIVPDLDAADPVAGDACLTGNGSDQILRPNIVASTDAEIETGPGGQGWGCVSRSPLAEQSRGGRRQFCGGELVQQRLEVLGRSLGECGAATP